jgi:hypothetical protein
MTTWKELVYIILDSLKIHSDDSKFTEDHVVFLLSKYRAYILNQMYSKVGKSASNANYQYLEVELESTSNKSKTNIPHIMSIGKPIIGADCDQEEITFVPMDRFKYIGHNRFLNNIIYCTVNIEGKLEFNKIPTKNNGKLTEPCNKCTIYAIFSNPLDVYDKGLDILDEYFPVEETLIPSILELVMKDLTNGLYKPSDNTNDAQDALSDLAGFLRRNMKSQFQKQIDE